MNVAFSKETKSTIEDIIIALIVAGVFLTGGASLYLQTQSSLIIFHGYMVLFSVLVAYLANNHVQRFGFIMMSIISAFMLNSTLS